MREETMGMEQKRPIQETGEVKPIEFSDELQVDSKTDQGDKGDNKGFKLETLRKLYIGRNNKFFRI